MEAEITIALGSNKESEEALKVLKEAVKILREDYGIWVHLIPVDAWVYDPIKVNMLNLPQIYVNGRLIFSGTVPTVDELIDVVVALLWSTAKHPGLVPTATFWNEPFNAVGLAEAWL